MRERDPETSTLSRREALRWMAVAPLASAVGCSTNAVSGTDAAVADTALTDAALTDAALTDAAAASGWASGGTAAMTDLLTYPNPFTAVTDTTCTPTCAMTLGPCHDDEAPGRQDVSEGERGLPMRLGLRILDSNCQPVTDANVDIWHCDVAGIYSSATVDNVPFCTGNDAAALASQWFRGHQQTDAEGVAWFSSCFPGWYPSRAIHIHFTVRRSDRSGTEYLTSQVCFPTALIEDVCTTHPDYSGHGLPDTANTADTVFPAATVDLYTLETRRMTDGALLAWKTILIRSALSESVCGSGGGMP